MNGNGIATKYVQLTLAALPLVSTLPIVHADSAGTFSAGLQAIEEGRYEAAAQYIGYCASHGEAPCQAIMGTLHQLGLGMEKDEYIAFELTHKAAEQDYAPAQLNLGLMYISGEGVTEDEYIGLDWIERAAMNGSQEAKQILTQLLEAPPEGC